MFKNKIASLTESFHLTNIILRLEKEGAIPILVGGAVRDLFFRRSFKDIDIEVYGIKEEKLVLLLEQFSIVEKRGASFGVFVLKKHPFVDWSLPREDISRGRRPEVHLLDNKIIDYQRAFRRRDFTINSMGINLLTGKLIDLYGGEKDIEKRRLHPVSLETFEEDPLRFYRAMQFIGRFNLKASKELLSISSKMKLRSLANERVRDEFFKLITQSKEPSKGLLFLQKSKNQEDLFYQFLLKIKNKKAYRDKIDLLAKMKRDKKEKWFLFLQLNTYLLQSPFFLTRSREEERSIRLFLKLTCIAQNEKWTSYYRASLLSFYLKENFSLFFSFLSLVSSEKICRALKLSFTKNKYHEKYFTPLLTGRDMIEKKVKAPEIQKKLDEAMDLELRERINSKSALLKKIFNEPLKS